ncbi:MAG: hypothetical protein WA160_08495 [Pseudobdellovibrio sp.]
MNALKIVFFFSSLLVFGCTSFQPHKSEIYPVRQDSGATQVKVKFHDTDKVNLGDSVNAYTHVCQLKVNAKGLERNICHSKLVGKGKINKFYEDKTALVEFDSSVQIDESNKFEVE